MMLEPLPPRVQDHQAADVSAQALRIRGDLLQRLRGGLKEEVVYHAFVDERQTRQWLGHREDEVDVPDGQEFPLAGRDPRITRGGQTFWAMPVAAAVEREGRVCALVTAIAVPAERRGAAVGNRPKHAPMLPGDPRGVDVQKAIAVLAHDVGHLKGWPRHRCASTGSDAPCRDRIVSASSGFATAADASAKMEIGTVCRTST